MKKKFKLLIGTKKPIKNYMITKSKYGGYIDFDSIPEKDRVYIECDEDIYKNIKVREC